MDNLNFEFIKQLDHGSNKQQFATLNKTQDILDYETEYELTFVDILGLSKAVEIVSEFYDVKSVVIAKGDGVVAIPITEDKIIVESLLESLNPKLMTSPGSSIGKGILRAKETFEKNYSTAGRIWVFTDGEETDNQLKNALTECIKSGIPVSIIGFGSEKETSVYAGDGITTVKTALRTKAINDAILEVNKKTNYLKNKTQIQFVKADEKGSAAKLINQLITKENSHITNITTYEEKPVPRYKLFSI